MELGWLLLARHAEITRDRTMNIFDAGVDCLVIAKGSLPAKGDIYLAGCVVASMDEWQETHHNLTTSVVTPDGSRYGKRSFNLQHNEPPSMLKPGAMPGQLFALPQYLRLRTCGIYLVEVVLDGQKRHSLPISVLELE